MTASPNGVTRKLERFPRKSSLRVATCTLKDENRVLVCHAIPGFIFMGGTSDLPTPSP